VVLDLNCDSTVNPLGVDDLQPRFHWTLKARDETLRNIQQTAFQILVASSRTKLDRERAKRGCGLVHNWDREGFEIGLDVGKGGIWLRLTVEQYLALGGVL
jgi:hypothetical protein